MDRSRPPFVAAAVLLAALAGFVDALAYLNLGGFFAAFMSGNTTRLGVGLATGDFASGAVAAALILSFVCGVMIATMLAARFPRRHRAAVMLAVTVLLALAALLSGFTDRGFPLMLLAVAMGAENGIFDREGEFGGGLTYITGTLVRFGQRLTGALIGSDSRFGWVPWLLMWLGFALGVLVGGRAHLVLGNAALWAAAGAAALLTLVVAGLTWNGRPE
ncbi:MAG TPA: YoaK family protein [Sphingomonas sp.]|nr:YoaK family protein [Sphingomonas sp.]